MARALWANTRRAEFDFQRFLSVAGIASAQCQMQWIQVAVIAGSEPQGQSVIGADRDA